MLILILECFPFGFIHQSLKECLSRFLPVLKSMRDALGSSYRRSESVAHRSFWLDPLC